MMPTTQRKKMLSQEQIQAATEHGAVAIADPLVIMYPDPHDAEKVICRLHPQGDEGYQHYGLLVCDLVRHVAKFYRVDEDAVWEWVDKERLHPTTEVTEAS
jgi:hypothetical protein